MIYNSLLKHCHRFLDKSQFGFVRNNSTEKQLIAFLHCIYDKINNHQRCQVLYTDLSKAFDNVDHNILLYKLSHYGISGNNIALLKSYLCERNHRVVINGCFSDLLPMTSGVPQGSLLGPFLFIMYLNDFSSNQCLGEAFLFADDTKVIIDNNNILSAHDAVASYIRWFDVNKMLINNDKSGVMCFNYGKQAHVKSAIVSHLNELGFNLSTTQKDLGILINNNITWDNHINFILTKGNKLFYLFRRNCSSLSNSHIRRFLFNTYINPILSYCSCAFYASRSAINTMDSFFYRILKWIYNDYKTAYKALLISNHFLPIGYLYDFLDCLMLCKILLLPGNLTIPNNLQLPKHLVIRSNKKFNQVFPSLEIVKHDFWYRAVDLANILPDNMCWSNVNIFKKQLQNLFLKHFSNNYSRDLPCTWRLLCRCPNCRGITKQKLS